MRATLDEIGLKYRTDKSSSHHNYLSFYESFMAPLRDAPITLLEIGVYQGASLKTWREYFTRAKIIGVDIQPNCKQFESERIKIELADQSNLEHLAKLAATHGPFDLIIEDGSHMWGSSLNRVGKGRDFVIPRFARGWLAVSERDARHRSFPVGLGSDVALEGDAN